jgi:hypothetical protein
VEHQPATRRHGVDQMPQRAAEPVQLPRHEGLSWPELGEYCIQLRPAVECPGGRGRCRPDSSRPRSPRRPAPPRVAPPSIPGRIPTVNPPPELAKTERLACGDTLNTCASCATSESRSRPEFRYRARRVSETLISAPHQAPAGGGCAFRLWQWARARRAKRQAWQAAACNVSDGLDGTCSAHSGSDEQRPASARAWSSKRLR